MPISLSVKGLDEAAKAIDSLSKTIPTTITTQVNAVFDKAYDQMYRDCPVRTGYLRSTIKKTSGTGKTLAQINVTAPYAGIVNFGSGSRPPKPFATNGYYFILAELKRINISNR